MGSRVRVAASVCLVASGLFIAGIGGALALADPENGGGQSDDRQSQESTGGGSRDGGDVGQGSDDGIRDPDDGKDPGSAPPKEEDSKTEPHTPQGEPEPQLPVPPLSDCSSKSSSHCSSESSYPPTTPTSTTESEAPGGSGGGGDGGGGAIELPNGRHLEPPDMQLPSSEPIRGQLGAPDAAPGLADAAAQAPLPPIALPVIVPPVVVPPVVVPAPAGVGAADGGAPAGPHGLELPTGPKPILSEPRAGRSSEPSGLGNNTAAAPLSHRIGYVEYLRTAGMSQIAALALPGSAGLMAITSLGGLVGYRQAKAGNAVHTGGTARFMH